MVSAHPLSKTADLVAASSADVEVHPVPVEVLQLLRLELDPRHLVVVVVWKW
jgi:hypothetical protein